MENVGESMKILNEGMKASMLMLKNSNTENAFTPSTRRNFLQFMRIKLSNFKASFYGWGSTILKLQSHCEDTVYFFPLRPLDFLVLI